MKYFQHRPINITVAKALPVVLVLCTLVTPHASGLTLNAGDILVADPDFVHFVLSGDIDSMQPALWKIDPHNGMREVVTSKERGGGVPLRSVTQVVVDGLGRITIADAYSDSLLRVNPITGDRSCLSGGACVNGAIYHSVSALAVDHDNSLVILDHLSHSIFRVDGDTGDVLLISGSTRGDGPTIQYESTLAVDKLGTIWTTVWDQTNGSALLKVNPATGDRNVVSGWGNGAGQDFFSDIRDIQIIDDQTVVGVNMNRIVQIDLLTGERTFFDTQGPRIESMFAVARSSDGTFVVADEGGGNVFRVDPIAGVHTLLSGNTPEWGPRMWMPQDIFVVVPEPNVISLAVIALLMRAFRRRQR